MRLVIILSFLFSFNINSQSVSEKEFEKRLDFERGNYAIQNYNQSFLDRPDFVWGILKSKKDNIIYMASNGGVLEYDGVSVRRVSLKEDTTYNSDVIGLARTVVEMDNGQIYVTGNNRFGRLVQNQYGFNEFEYLLHKLPDSVDYRRQVIWGSLELDGNVYMNTPNYIFRWNGEKFDKIWKFSEYAGARNAKGKIHAFSLVGGELYTRRWGHGIYKLENEEFKFIENSEIFSQNRIEIWYKTSEGDILIFSRSLGAYILKKNGEFVKSKNKTLNEWLIKNAVYVHDDLGAFSDNTIPILPLFPNFYSN